MALVIIRQIAFYGQIRGIQLGKDSVIAPIRWSPGDAISEWLLTADLDL